MRRLLFVLPVLLAACAGTPSPRDPLLSDRKLDLEMFFDGDLVAHGQFQDILGTVRRRFEVRVRGDWDGTRLRLVEDFVYEDGATERRIWTLASKETVSEIAPRYVNRLSDLLFVIARVLARQEAGSEARRGNDGFTNHGPTLR